MDISRRSAMAAGVAVAGIAARSSLPAWAAPAERGAKVAMPRVCGLEDPLALGDLPPRFSWLAEGVAQRAYRITVAADEADLSSGQNLLWDSGEVASARCTDIAFGGKVANGRALWQVEVWPVSGRPIQSAISTWESGVSEWTAEWLACETETARRDRLAGLHWVASKTQPKTGASRYFRAVIESKAAEPAELLLSANETQGVWINGEKVIAPQDGPIHWTTMAVYPLALRPGSNCIAVEVARRTGFGAAPPVLAAVLRRGAALADRRALLADDWKVSLTAGDGWQAPQFGDSGWEAAIAATGTLPVGQPWPNYPASHLRRGFKLDRPVRRARLYATALGAYEPWLNGHPIGNARMTPEFTDPSKHILYQAYDVTALLAMGDNMLGFWAGDGTYGSKYSTSGRFAFGPAPCRLRAQLEIEFADGTRTRVTTGADWEIADSAIRESSVYDGEVYDARLARADWARAGSTGQNWRPAETIDAPAVPIDPQRCPPIRAHETLQPKSITRLRTGVYVIDFGQNFAGWPRLSVKAAAGTRIDMRFAESIRPDGEIDQANLRTAWARDVYIAAGKGRETWQPRFTYHGFRYVQVSGVPDSRDNWSIEGLAGYQSLDISGDFQVADPVIRKFWENSVWSQKSNFWGLPTDCPQRDERLGWIGDAEVFWEAASFNMDTQAYTARVMDDMRRGQRTNGAFPDCIPPFVPGMDLSSPGWADGGIILPHIVWRQYGDTGIVDANWDAMERHMGWIATNNPDHLWLKSRGADYGDWLSVDSNPANPGSPTTPKDLIGTAFWAANAQMMAEMADATGRKAEAARYAALFGTIRAAFNTAYVKADGRIGNESQTSYILPIRFGLLSQDAAREAGRRLVADIDRRGGHLSTGFLGTPHILDALAMTGQEATAVSLLLQRSFPSWGYMVEKGATSMWERWNSDKSDGGMNSLNHYAFGAIGAFLFRRIAGIAPAAPAFTRVRIAPIIDARLRSSGASYRSASGTIRTDWKVTGKQFRLDVELPPGVAGDVILPGGKAANAKSGLNRFSGALG